MRAIARRTWNLLLPAALLVLSGLPARALDVEWVEIDDPGNLPDDEYTFCCDESIGLTGFGRVDYFYRIGRTEITNAQYAEFLNAVAAAGDPVDPAGLYNFRMGDPFRPQYGHISHKDFALALSRSKQFEINGTKDRGVM